MPTSNSILPQRKHLPHDIPSWVQQGARHFITINCLPRGTDTLCHDTMAEALLTGIIEYERLGRWYIWLALIMPDHLHMIVTFDLQRGIQATLTAWKGFQAKELGIKWQSGFFEHRLRTGNEFNEKAAYIRMNPVRKRLVESPELWPYVLDHNGREIAEK